MSGELSLAEAGDNNDRRHDAAEEHDLISGKEWGID